MTAKTLKKLTFQEFLEQYPDGYGIYELLNGGMVKVQPIRAHKNIARYLVKCFDREIDRLNLDYIVDKDIVVRTVTGDGIEQGRIPDVAVVSKTVWNSKVLAYAALTDPIQLAVEVVSTNWEDDYVDKLDEYQRLGNSEYWIVDYLAIASRSYLGNPKVPTVFVYSLISGHYQSERFTEKDRIISPTFPELNLTVEQLFAASNI